MSLRTGAELITLTVLLNKVSGLYGLLAILTGYHLNTIQLSMYIYSVVALALTAYLSGHIRKQSPLQCLALAWFYVLDTIVNATYTATFGVTWFLVISQHHKGDDTSKAGPGAGTIGDTAGFTNPEYNVSSVNVAAKPASGLQAGQDAVAAGVPSDTPAGTGSSNIGASPSLGHGVLQPESFNSIGLICTLWTIRLYFCVIMLAYARFVLRQHIAASSSKPSSMFSYTSASTSSSLAENPFSSSKPEGLGWKGKLGRAMISVGKKYWLGAEDDDQSWMAAVGGKFRRNERAAESGAAGGLSVPSGPIERERRRRSGTGPPPVVLPLEPTQGKGAEMAP
ncbi:MAG: hypothetical protein Q9227_005814 [Pyrenula ochraceoflavens]